MKFVRASPLALLVLWARAPEPVLPMAGERADAAGGLILNGETVAPKGPGPGLINRQRLVQGPQRPDPRTRPRPGAAGECAGDDGLALKGAC